MRASVIGSPVSHSLSPAIFKFISQDQGREISYHAREVKPGEESRFINHAKVDSSFVGMNVTIPLKELVIKEMNSISEAVKALGAMNVVHLKDGEAFGHNTDVIGIEKTFQKCGFHVAGSRALLWGAGGSAKAVAYTLGKLKAREVLVYNRSPRGTELAETYSKLFPETKFQSISSLHDVSDHELSLMINTTPLGMQGQESGHEYFSQARTLKFSKDALAFDLIYVPAETDFLRVASHLGLKTISGLGMLIDQALATWEIWVGPIKNWDELHEKVKRFLSGLLHLRQSVDPVYLTGFMGAGKTTVGKILSELTQRDFIDTDTFIETRSGKSVPEIFASMGEEGFRKLESEALKELSLRKNVIISLGGGALKLSENINVIRNSGKLVYLKARLEVLNDRIENDPTVRPLLSGLDGQTKLHKISALLSEREKIYQNAEFEIETSALSPLEVGFEVVSRLGEKSEG